MNTSSSRSSTSQSRLAQPSSRLSFVPSAATRFTTTNSFRTTQVPLKQQTKMDSSSSVASSTYQSTVAYADRQHHHPASTLNMSGLPAPKSSFTAQSHTNECSTPSTVGSAIRRRQATPVLAPFTPTVSQLKHQTSATRLPSPSVSVNSDSSSSCSSASKQQSSLITETQPALSSARRQTTTFGVQVRTSSKSEKLTQKQQCENDETVKVQSLPPLRSASYISRVISKEPPASTGQEQQAKEKAQSIAQVTPSKPSQLVKPLMINSSVKRATESRQIYSKLPNSIQPLKFKQTQSISKTSSFVVRKQIGEEQTARDSEECQADKSIARKTSGFELVRRLSLQHSGYNIKAEPRLASKERNLEDTPEESSAETNGVQNSLDSEAGESEDDENEVDTVDSDIGIDEAEDEDDDDEDDDATTATTMTQMSDLNMSNTNQELNNMIQMLSSSVILADTINDEKLNNSSSSTSYENTNSKLKPPKTKSQLPEVKNRVMKSQSLSFNHHNQQQHQIFNRKNPKNSWANEEEVKKLVNESDIRKSKQQESNLQHLPSSFGSKFVNIPRPRSRIIFDPTSNQFHVSCSFNDAIQSNSNISTSIESANSFSDHPLLTDKFEVDEQDEASLKLLDTQNKIISLKCLPSSNGHLQMEEDEDEAESKTVRRLRDCRGSLESLLMTKAKSNEVEKQEPRDFHSNYSSIQQKQQQPAPAVQRRRSPVGSAIRSLFGLNSSQTNRGSSQPITTPSAKSNRVATVMRHGSLRSDPRAYNGFERENSEPDINTSNSIQSTPLSKSAHIGSDLFQRASKKFSASSSSLTSKFKFISSTSSSGTVNRSSTDSSGIGSTDGASADMENQTSGISYFKSQVSFKFQKACVGLC